MKMVCEEPETVHTAEALQTVVTSASPILAERIKPAKDLRHAISLNDSFPFCPRAVRRRCCTDE